MLQLKERKILLASEPVDFRLSMDGLVKIVTENIKNDPHNNAIYVFYNKNRNRVKLLFWDRNGFVLYYKRLDIGKFFLGSENSGLIRMNQEQLDLLLSGYNPKYAQKLLDK